MVSAPGCSKPVPPSYVEYFTMSTAWAWVHRGCLWCWRRPVWSLCWRRHVPVAPRTTDLWHWSPNLNPEERLGAAPALGQPLLEPLQFRSADDEYRTTVENKHQGTGCEKPSFRGNIPSMIWEKLGGRGERPSFSRRLNPYITVDESRQSGESPLFFGKRSINHLEGAWTTGCEPFSLWKQHSFHDPGDTLTKEWEPLAAFLWASYHM